MAKPVVRLKIKGQETLRANIQTIAKKYPLAAKQTLFEQGERLRSIAVPLTPLDKGPLRNSAFVNTPVRTSRGFKVVVGYGGAAAAYAVPQHERLDFKHTEGEAKFLEKAVDRIKGDLLETMARQLAIKAARINLKPSGGK